MTILEYAIEVNVVLNLVLSLIIIVWDLYFYFKMDEREKWTKLFYAFVGLCWFVRYVLYFYNFETLDRDVVNAPLVFLVTLTLLALAVGSIIRVQKLVGFDGMKSDFRTLIDRIKSWIFKAS